MLVITVNIKAQENSSLTLLYVCFYITFEITWDIYWVTECLENLTNSLTLWMWAFVYKLYAH